MAQLAFTAGTEPNRAPPLRDYQQRTVDAVRERLASGSRSVCVVIPTGGGKTRVGCELAGDRARLLWVAHRTELIAQAAHRLRESGHDVGVIAPGAPPDPWAPVQVGSVDTLIARGHRPQADRIIWDEAHHCAADTYAGVLESYPDAELIGLTATPQRGDGKPLGDYYSDLVVGATYSELIEAGCIVPCRVRRPSEPLGSDLAKHPLDEWRNVAEGRLTFAFAPSVKQARQWAREFTEAGIPSAHVEGGQDSITRRRTLADFRAGNIRVLWNVYVLTEGVDVPEAGCCLLARGIGASATYLQIVGRVLRPHPDKPDAILIDMPGASHVHGLPTADREYALTGRAIRVTGEALKNCRQCGTVVPVAVMQCDCGFAWPKLERKKPKIFDLELQWAVEQAGGNPEDVDEAHKRREWDRLLTLCQERERWSVSFAKREFKKLFGADPPVAWRMASPPELKMRELAALRGIAKSRGYKPGWVGVRFKDLFGHWPPRGR